MNVMDVGLLVAATFAGTGGCLLGVRAADALNRRLGRPRAGEEHP